MVNNGRDALTGSSLWKDAVMLLYHASRRLADPRTKWNVTQQMLIVFARVKKASTSRMSHESAAPKPSSRATCGLDESPVQRNDTAYVALRAPRGDAAIAGRVLTLRHLNDDDQYEYNMPHTDVANGSDHTEAAISLLSQITSRPEPVWVVLPGSRQAGCLSNKDCSRTA